MKVMLGAVYVHMAVGVFFLIAIMVMLGGPSAEAITRFAPVHWPLIAAIDFAPVVFLVLVLADAAAVYILHSQRRTVWRRRIVVSYLVVVPLVAVVHMGAGLGAASVGVFQDATGASLVVDSRIGFMIVFLNLIFVSPVVLVAVAE